MTELRPEKERKKRRGQEEGKKVSKKGKLFCREECQLKCRRKTRIRNDHLQPRIIHSDSGKDHQYAKTIG